MIEWLTGNKEWFFSGLGIFIVTCFFSGVTAIATLWLKGRGERKKRKHLQLTEKTVKFEIPIAEGEIGNDLLSVSYEGKQYKHLCHYTLTALNVGSVAIEDQKLLLSLPEGSVVLEQVVRPTNSFVKIGIERTSDTNEFLYTIDRLEHGDRVVITILTDLAGLEAIHCSPRGVDSIDYSREKSETTTDLDVFIYFVAAIILAGTVPFIGGILQALVVIAGSSLFVRIAKLYILNKKSDSEALVINGGINMSDSAVFQINQPTSSTKE